MSLQRNLREFIKTHLEEISTTGGAPGYSGKFFISRKSLGSNGYKPVNRKKQTKNSKMYDYRDLWGSTYDD